MERGGHARVRADQALVDQGLAETRSRAQALILAGLAFAGETRIGKAGDMLRAGTPLTVRGRDHPFVSRGGVKLDHALRHFALDAAGAVALDIGASTGGFTDVLLRAGAARVHAVDVGHGQLAWSLRSDPRVVVHERVNARHLAREALGGDRPTVLVCDASFIGLRTLLPAPLSLIEAPGWAVALIKPQFEVGPGGTERGVVRDAGRRAAVCEEISAWWAGLPGWRVLGVTESPINGPEGNVEFLIGAVREAGC